MRTEKSDPDRVYQNIPPAKQKQAGRFFDAATALACLLCAGATFYLFGFGMAAETFVFFITACAGLIGTHHFVSEPTIHRRRYAGTTATLAFVAMLLSGSSMLRSTPSTYRFAAVFMAYFFPIALACWLVLLARRLYGWLHNGEPFIFFGDLFSSSNETLTELGQSLSPKARSVINLVLAAFFTVWAIVETVDTLNYAAAEMQVSPEETVTLQYAQLCLERDCGVAPEQIETTTFTLTPEEEWSNSWEDLYSYTFTWEGETSAESRCYSLVFFDDFTCELIGQGPDYAASLADAQAELEWRQSGHTTPRR